jgi:ribosome-associated protein
MESTLSRSEKKRQAKDVEKLSHELAELPPADLAKLPCDDFLRREIAASHNLKGGAKKRQIKYVARELRQLELAEMLTFLEERQGSRLKSQGEEKELERLRNEILEAAIREFQERLDPDERFRMDRQAAPLQECANRLPGFELEAAARAAEDFAATRKPNHSRQLLKIIRGAAERQRFPRSGAGK